MGGWDAEGETGPEVSNLEPGEASRAGVVARWGISGYGRGGGGAKKSKKRTLGNLGWAAASDPTETLAS